jgi:hypothetical protein
MRFLASEVALEKDPELEGAYAKDLTTTKSDQNSG